MTQPMLKPAPEPSPATGREAGARAQRQAAPITHRSHSWTKLWQSLAVHGVLLLMAVLMVFPLLWLVSSSLKTPDQQYAWPPRLIPWPVRFANFTDLFQMTPMATYLFNSFKIAILAVIGMCLSCSLAAFAFARMRFRGSDLVFSILLATMMIPFAITMIPTFVVFRSLGWIDTHLPLIAPSFLGGAFMVFLLRQAYQSIPQELVDAAQIDGAGFFTIYWRIFIPLGMAVMATVALLTFLYSWNDLVSPLIYLNSQEKMTVPLGLAFLRGRAGTGVEKYGIIMAGSLLGVVPMLILYSLGQKYFVQGLARAGLKG